jgi:hypothetical protein
VFDNVSSLRYELDKEITDIDKVEIGGIVIVKDGSLVTGDMVFLQLDNGIKDGSWTFNARPEGLGYGKGVIPFAIGNKKEYEIIGTYRYAEGKMLPRGVMFWKDKDGQPKAVSGFIGLKVHTLGWNNV